ncbi:hypothetical protein G7046_g7914 [Stylonectria norvegica]|nr:hypothetical protein G7046_g7914 [Stylonectria norvegica]
MAVVYLPASDASHLGTASLVKPSVETSTLETLTLDTPSETPELATTPLVHATEETPALETSALEALALEAEVAETEVAPSEVIELQTPLPVVVELETVIPEEAELETPAPEVVEIEVVAPEAADLETTPAEVTFLEEVVQATAEYKFEGWMGEDISAAEGNMVWKEYEPKAWEESDVDIKITHSGICGTDIHTLRAGWGPTDFPCVVGHEIVGIAVRVGTEAEGDIKVGDRVGVGAQTDSCRSRDGPCTACESHEENYCLDTQLTYNTKFRNGGKAYGGYAIYHRSPSHFVIKIPDGLAPEHAAPMLCGGVTVYSPLKLFGAGPGKRIGVVGVGGLGHFAVLIARAMGVDRVVGISRKADKREEALKLGADEYIATDDDEDWANKYANSLDLIICTVSSPKMPLEQYLGLLALDGTLVQVGIPEEPIPMSVWALVPRRRRLVGSLIGSPNEIHELFQLAADKHIVPWVETRPMADANQAILDMEAGKPRFRYVLTNDFTLRDYAAASCKLGLFVAMNGIEGASPRRDWLEARRRRPAGLVFHAAQHKSTAKLASPSSATRLSSAVAEQSTREKFSPPIRGLSIPSFLQIEEGGGEGRGGGRLLQIPDRLVANGPYPMDANQDARVRARHGTAGDRPSGPTQQQGQQQLEPSRASEGTERHRHRTAGAAVMLVLLDFVLSFARRKGDEGAGVDGVRVRRQRRGGRPMGPEREMVVSVARYVPKCANRLFRLEAWGDFSAAYRSSVARSLVRAGAPRKTSVP